MTGPFHRRTTCRLCDSGDLDLVLSLPPTPPETAYGNGKSLEATGGRDDHHALDLVLCAACGHVQLADVVDPFQVFQRGRSPTASFPTLVRQAHGLAHDILATRPPGTKELVVAIGSNDGTILAPFEAAGCRVHGVEPAVDLARIAIERGIETFPGFFKPGIARRLEDEHGRANVIMARSVLAYEDDLAAVLEGITTLLAKDGVFVFEVPALADIVVNGLFDGIRHEVLSYHTVAPLRRLLLSHDLDLFAVEDRRDLGGVMRGWCQRLGAGRRARDSVAAAIARESAHGLDHAATLRNIADHVVATRNRMASLLSPILDRGGTVAGYGATGRAVTLCHAIGLDDDTLQFVVDDNDWKHGLTTPGSHRPIVPATEIAARRPSAVVILAWPFADEIIARHADYGAGGGQFIVPLPHPHIAAAAERPTPSG